MLGASPWLTACDGAPRLAAGVARLNDRMETALFTAPRAAPEYASSSITRPFPFAAFYPRSLAPAIDDESYKLELLGRIADRQPYTLADLEALPQRTQATRLVCGRGWSAIAEWRGPRLADLLERSAADTGARFVGCKCADDYYTSIDMATALHPQTLLATAMNGAPLAREFGYPLRLIVPTKLGLKSAKYLTAVYVTNAFPGGYWEDRGHPWLSAL